MSSSRLLASFLPVNKRGSFFSGKNHLFSESGQGRQKVLASSLEQKRRDFFCSKILPRYLPIEKLSGRAQGKRFFFSSTKNHLRGPVLISSRKPFLPDTFMSNSKNIFSPGITLGFFFIPKEGASIFEQKKWPSSGQRRN